MRDSIGDGKVSISPAMTSTIAATIPDTVFKSTFVVFDIRGDFSISEILAILVSLLGVDMGDLNT